MSQAQLDQQKEIARLRRELKIAQQERDILKKDETLVRHCLANPLLFTRA